MENLIQQLATHASAPRIWLEHLAIFSEDDAQHCIRAINFRRGLNVIWAKEPPLESAHTGIHAAGHGVGKTSLCLLIRYCLADTAKAVHDLREELYQTFPKGGVAVVVHVDGRVFTVFRYFSQYKDGMMFANNGLETLFLGKHQPYKDFEAFFTAKMLEKVSPKQIPITKQAIDWRHILAWISRDQGARFKDFYAWREGEGTGLQQSRKDPPIIMQAVLGLLADEEAKLVTDLRNAEILLKKAEDNTIHMQQEPLLIKKRIESELRTWLGIGFDLPIYTDDWIEDSVEKRILAANQQSEQKRALLDQHLQQANQQLYSLYAQLEALEKSHQVTKIEYDLAKASLDENEQAIQLISQQKAGLQNLQGLCSHGKILFQDCSYVKQEMAQLQSSNIKDLHQQNALNASDWTNRQVIASAQLNALDSQIANLKQEITEQQKQCHKWQTNRDSELLDIDRARRMLTELERWAKLSGSPDTASAIEKSITHTEKISKEIGLLRAQLKWLQEKKSDRERRLTAITNILADKLFSNEVSSSFAKHDEYRPFKLNNGGEAYRVLEVLLGDLVCLLDSAVSKTAFPGLLIHDCPREADMSAGIYGKFLQLMLDIEQAGYAIAGQAMPYQYIVTTTTPPPELLQHAPYLIETLDPCLDDGLLFKQRFQFTTNTIDGLI